VPVGTIPHALIATSGGDTVQATERFAKHIRGANIVALVDFDNDCVGTSLAVAKSLGKRLLGVRLDTAADITDVSVSSPGVNPELVRRVRQELDRAGYAHVTILVSGGFTSERIRMFEKESAPVDGYGVGSALVHGNNDFTADVVQVNGKGIAKVGRVYKSNNRLKNKTNPQIIGAFGLPEFEQILSVTYRCHID
jgi:nicotinate phosphoribosyltransferase